MNQFLDLGPDASATTSDHKKDDALSHMARILNNYYIDFSSRSAELQHVAKLLSQAGCNSSRSHLAAKITSPSNLLRDINFAETAERTAEDVEVMALPARTMKRPATGEFETLKQAVNNNMVEILAAYNLSTLSDDEQTALMTHIINKTGGKWLISEFPGTTESTFDPAASTSCLALMAHVIGQGLLMFVTDDAYANSPSFAMMADERLRHARLIKQFITDNPADLAKVRHRIRANSIGYELDRLCTNVFSASNNNECYNNFNKVYLFLERLYIQEKREFNLAQTAANKLAAKNPDLVSKAAEIVALSSRQIALNKLFRAFLNKDITDSKLRVTGFVSDINTFGTEALTDVALTVPATAPPMAGAGAASSAPVRTFALAPSAPEAPATDYSEILAAVKHLLANPKSGFAVGLTDVIATASMSNPLIGDAVIESASDILSERAAARQQSSMLATSIVFADSEDPAAAEEGPALLRV